MLIDEARKIFINLGRSYFWADIGLKSPKEIIESMKEHIQCSTTLSGVKLWEKEKDAVFLMSMECNEDELDNILLEEFGILREDFGNSKEFSDNLANELEISIQQVKQSLQRK